MDLAVALVDGAHVGGSGTAYHRDRTEWLRSTVANSPLADKGKRWPVEPLLGRTVVA
jgi:hypothetical protein